MADALRAVKSPYNVNSLSQAVGAAVLRHREELQAARKTILASCRELRAGLERQARQYPGRFTLLPGETNFAALSMPDGEALLHFLGERGVAIRYTGGLVRITCGTPEENRILLTELEAYWNRERT